MSKKHLLQKTKQDFVDWLYDQDDAMQYDMITTTFRANTELGKFRRFYIKYLNDRNYRKLKV